ncbi:MAG: mandelate racemase/muconate lactonizing enzyme family protein [Pseudomonadota bacterium]
MSDVRVTGFRLHALRSAFRGGGFTTAYGRRTHLNNLLLVLESNVGLTGYGEICRKSGASPEPTDPSFSRACDEALRWVLGCDPFNSAEVRAALGISDPVFSNLASAFETACYDLCAKKAGVPLWSLLGGRYQESVPVYRSISQAHPEVMALDAATSRIKGCTVFQMKIAGEGDPELDAERIRRVMRELDREDETVLVDANGAMDVATAVDLMHRFPDPRIYWEEPCASYEANRDAARRGGGPVILDQCITGPNVCMRACRDGAVAGLGIKCTMQGGPGPARLSRDLAIAHGMKIKVDDSWSADIASAASLHLALGVPPDLLLCSVDMRSYFEDSVARSGPVSRNYRFRPADAPGLGVDVDPEKLEPMLLAT